MRQLLRGFAYGLTAVVLAIALLGSALPAGAQTQSTSSALSAPSVAKVRPNDIAVGDHTRALLDVQRSGSQAGPLHPLTGEQAALGYARYMRSFNHPLPEFFTTQATGSPLRGGAGSQSVNGQ